MGSLIKHAKKIKKACIGIATGVTVATMMIPPIVLSQMIMMDQEDKCSSEATGSIDVSSDGTVEENKKAIWNYFKASGYSDEATAGIMGICMLKVDSSRVLLRLAELVTDLFNGQHKAIKQL